MPADRPHVLQILTDQQQAAALGAVDDSYDTPNLDRLAREGSLFANCYTTHPQCSPARSSLVTGQFPHQTGVYTLPYWGGYPIDVDSHSVGRQFVAAGYDAVWAGKWHLGEDTLEPLGWERPPATPGEPDDAAIDSRIGTDRRTTDRALAYLDGHDHAAEPFFLTVSYRLPHPGYVECPAVADRYDREAVPLPESFRHAREDPETHLRDRPDYLRERRDDLALDASRVREINYRYRTMVSQIDAYVGELLAKLEALGVRDETAILFTADHGDMTGAHGIERKGAIPFEEVLRVPLLLDVPGQTGRSQVEDLVSLAAVPGTLLDAAGLPVDPAFEGGSLLPAVEREGPPGTEQVFFEHKYAHWGQFPFRGVRRGDWKFVEHLGEGAGGVELYDLSEDPHELQNLAGDPAHVDRVADLREAVREWWTATGGDERDWVESPVPEDP